MQVPTTQSVSTKFSFRDSITINAPWILSLSRTRTVIFSSTDIGQEGRSVFRMVLVLRLASGESSISLGRQLTLTYESMSKCRRLLAGTRPLQLILLRLIERTARSSGSSRNCGRLGRKNKPRIDGLVIRCTELRHWLVNDWLDLSRDFVALEQNPVGVRRHMLVGIRYAFLSLHLVRRRKRACRGRIGRGA